MVDRVKSFFRSFLFLLGLIFCNAASAALTCTVQLEYIPSHLSKMIEFDTKRGDVAPLGRSIDIPVAADGLLDDWSDCRLFAHQGDSDPRRVREQYRYGSLQLKCEGKSNVFVRSFLANFLPGDEGLVHGEARIVDGYSGKALQIQSTCVFEKGGT